MATRRSSSRATNKPSAENASKSVLPTTNSKRKSEGSEAVATKKSKSDKVEKVSEQKSANEASSKGVLSEGKALPKITLKDESGKEIDVSKLQKAVIFTYPKANTPGCTTQACLFRDEYAEFQKIGFQVYGLSSDGEVSLKNWKDKKGFKYSLLSDPKRQLIGELTGSKSSTIRSHFVIDTNGNVAHSAIKVKPADSSSDALKVAKSL